MKEKDIQQIFKMKNKKRGVFELKLCKGISMPFNHVADHQIEALKAVSTDKGLYHKISDSPVSYGGQRFTKPKPFDCFVLNNIPAYVVICWYIPRVKREFHYIPIQKFIEKRNNTKRKSITEEMSAEIAEEIVQM